MKSRFVHRALGRSHRPKVASAGILPVIFTRFASSVNETLSMVAHYTKAVNQRTLADVAVLRLDTRNKSDKSAES